MTVETGSPPAIDSGEEWAQPTLSPAEYQRARHRYHARISRRAIPFLAPYVVIWAVFLAFPIAWGIWLSFNTGGIVGPREYVGFDNWRRALDDSELSTAVRNTAVYMVIAFGVVFVLAIFLASLLN